MLSADSASCASAASDVKVIDLDSSTSSSSSESVVASKAGTGKAEVKNDEIVITAGQLSVLCTIVSKGCRNGIFAVTEMTPVGLLFNSLNAQLKEVDKLGLGDKVYQHPVSINKMHASSLCAVIEKANQKGMFDASEMAAAGGLYDVLQQKLKVKSQ